MGAASTRSEPTQPQYRVPSSSCVELCLTVKTACRKSSLRSRRNMFLELPAGVSQPTAAVVMEQTTQSSTSLGHVLP